MNTWKKEELAYCSNVHAGTDIQSICDNLTNYACEVKNERLLASMNMGLWLSSMAADELCHDSLSLQRLTDYLNEQSIKVYTLNAFPFGDFHAEEVKENVYLPDWSNPERLNYSKQCARVLANIIQAQAEEKKGTFFNTAIRFWTKLDRQENRISARTTCGNA